MRHQEGTFKGIRDASIYYQCWLPEGESRAVLLIVHGLAEHSGRYMNVVNHFVPLGYAVYGVDHVGHGKSSGTRMYVERFEDYTDTLKIYFDMVRLWQPEKPVFLVGHSMGGLIGAVYLLDHQAELTGGVLSGPAVKVHGSVSPAVISVGKLISVLMPKLGLIGLEAEGVSRDPAVVQAYVNDPLVCRGKVTARLSAELVKAIRRVAAEDTKITLPILILQGSADRLVDPKGAQMLYDAVNSVDKTIKIYDGLYHEVYNEPEHGQVLGDVKAWLETHLSRRT
jgi:alpha-beta hydrolase superfamily lysophospholipase